ncbi:MAG: 3-deoxy-D-manno-octulosonic acid transferase [Ignavibacteria bacterium RBG_13_36_8]|nr:MAG: 3-deoxy-D-manno-octulosonic acid transferase [Ignavibacteria bacterium RBG_13_36_8]
MNKVWYYVYNFVIIPIAFPLFYFAGLFHHKVKKGIKDRKKLFEKLIIDLAGLDRSKKMVWFHSSSMGEFEQAKPIIERLRLEKNVNIAVTFYSPSGYDNSLNYPHADIVAYLPFDLPAPTERFLRLLQPDLVIFMRYDIWPNLMWQLDKKNIKSIIVDATMRENSKRKWFIAKDFHDTLYKGVSKILTVSKSDTENFLFFDIKKENVRAVGDTRFDRVYQKSLYAKNYKLFPNNFFKNKKVFVFGSSWESDEEVILPAVVKLIKEMKSLILILVPHEPTVQRLVKLEDYFANKTTTVRFSYINNYNGERVIIIDSIGILLTLYHYAHIAYVGGSFKQGIHNVLEPAVYGIPVLFGPKIQNSQEAVVLLKKGGSIILKNKEAAYSTLKNLLRDPKLRNKMGRISHDYVHLNIGATDTILEEIYKLI